jgi:hypothetical protein
VLLVASASKAHNLVGDVMVLSSHVLLLQERLPGWRGADRAAYEALLVAGARAPRRLSGDGAGAAGAPAGPREHQLERAREERLEADEVVLQDCAQVSALPRGLRCASLHLRGCPALLALPGALLVQGAVVARASALRTVPPDLDAGELNLADSALLAEVPALPRLRGRACLARCAALVSVALEYVAGDCDLRGCEALERLDACELCVQGDLNLTSCARLSQLPRVVRVDGNLRLEGCSALATLPANLHVAGSLFLNGTAVPLAQLLDNRGSLARVHGPKDEDWTPVGQLLRALDPAADAFAERCAGRLRSLAAALLLPPAFVADVAVLAFGLEPFADPAHRKIWLPYLQGPGFSGVWPEHLPALRPAAVDMLAARLLPRFQRIVADEFLRDQRVRRFAGETSRGL